MERRIYIEVGFGVRLGMQVFPTLALRLPPAEVQGALQGVFLIFDSKLFRAGFRLRCLPRASRLRKRERTGCQ